MKTTSSISGSVSLKAINVATIPTPKNGYIATDSADNKLKFYNESSGTWQSYIDLIDSKYDASNPNGYETPAQLDIRDAADRNRANHTGTQLSSTISNFASTVLGTVLTGISFVTNSAILATDTILVALGKIQSQINSHFGSGGTSHSAVTSSVNGFMIASDKVKLDGASLDKILVLSTALTNTSNTTFVTIPALQINAVAGTTYKFEINLLYDTAATTTGITLSLGGTATGTIVSYVTLPVNNTAGAANAFSGPISAINGVVTSTGVGTIGIQYYGKIEGIFIATTSGTFYPQFRSEVNASQVRINIKSNTVYKEY